MSRLVMQPRVFVIRRIKLAVDPLKPSGYYDYHRVSGTKIPRSAHAVYLCVLCGSQNKQRLFPYTALTDWFV
jgi:DNA-directed RNA polymerase subunit RPC12/RpoP